MQSTNNYEKSYAKNSSQKRVFGHRRSTVKGVVYWVKTAEIIKTYNESRSRLQKKKQQLDTSVVTLQAQKIFKKNTMPFKGHKVDNSDNGSLWERHKSRLYLCIVCLDSNRWRQKQIALLYTARNPIVKVARILRSTSRWYFKFETVIDNWFFIHVLTILIAYYNVTWYLSIV